MAGGPWDDYAPSAAKKPSAGPWEDYAPAQAPEPEKSGLLRRGIADTGVSLLRGAIAVPEAAVGIADIATGGRAGKAVQDVGVDFKRAKDIAGDFYSPEQKAANKAVADADGFFPTIAAAVQNPSVIAQSGIESVPSMLGGGVAAQGLRRMAPKVGAVGAAGIGEGLVGAGSSAEQIRQATDDGLLTDKQAALAAGSGALTSVIGAAGGAAARRLGIGDIDTIIAQGGRDIGEATSKGLLRRAGEGFVAEGALEEAPQSAQEQALQNIALDKPAGEGVGSAAGLGLLTGGAMGAAAAPFGARPAAGESAPPAVAPVEPVLDPPAPAPAAAPAPGDPLRATKLPEAGPLSRGINTLIEGEAQAADAGAPVQTPVTGALAGVPAEDAAPQIPVGEATEVDPIPAGEATELPADQVQPAAGPTFDPATGEITQPQRATFPTREAVDEYLRQARLQQGGERAKAAPVELPDGTFSFLRPNEPGYDEALTESKQTVLQRKRAAAAKVKAEAEQAKPPSVLQQRRAAAAAAKEAPALPAPVAPVTKPPTVLQQRRAAALAAKQNAGAPAADTGALGSAPSVATPPTAPAPTADDTNQPRRVSTEAQAPADQAQPPARGDGAARVAEPAVAGAAAVQAAGVAPDLAGKKIDKEWTAFAPDSGTKGVPRADMPQIKAEHRGAMTQFLGARGITHEQAEVPAADLKPTQAEFSTKKVKAARDFSDTDRSILVSSDGHILDGHHQWLAAREAGKSVKVIRLDAPIDKLLAEVKEFPSAAASNGATLPADQEPVKKPEPAPAVAAEAAEPAPAPAPIKKPEATATAKAKIEDFGEKLEGARKDYAATLKDAESVDVAAEPLSKSWPEPDYQKLLDGGADPYIVAFIHAARDELPTKPQKPWKLKGWVQQAEMLRGMAQKLLSGAISAQTVRDRLAQAEFNVLQKNVGSRADLYELVGHAHSLKGITFAEHHYSLYRGERDVRKWVVEQKAKATSFSNWPREIAVGNTREEALDAFKAKLGTLDLGRDAKKQPQFVIYRKRGQDGAWIGKKVGREYIDLKKLDDVAQARTFMADNLAALEAALAKYRETPMERRAENQPRVGDDHRNGAPVTPEIFADTFGFRGVQFGNYVEGDRRQSDLNESFDALMDLAAVLGVPPRALSLNGRLGLAFGARGKGGKNAPVAHYEPGTVVINLTKGSGPGSLAHEWWHAADNYFARDFGAGGFATDGVKLDGMRDAMQARFKEVRSATQALPLRRRAAALDKRRSKPYWNTPIELSARAFESYVIAKLKDQGAANDYLANVVDEQVWNITEAARAEFFGGESAETYPYPGQAELPAVRTAFDEFFRTVETREGEGGAVEMFDLGDPPAKPDTAAYGPASQAQRDLVAKLQQQLQARLPGVVLDAVAPIGRDDAGATGRGGSGERGIQGKSLAAVASVAKRLFNREVVFVRFTGDARFNGLASDAYPGKVFINVDANRPLMSVLGHELVHSMRASNPTTYEALKRRLDGLLKNEQRYIDALEAKYAERGVSTQGVRHGEELHADIVGDFFMDPVFWQDMAKDKPGLFRRVANAVIKFLDDAATQILDLRPFGTDQYLADIKAARAAVSTTLREFSDAAVGSAAASGDGIAFSLADSLTAGINNVKDVKLPAGYLVQDLFNRTGKLHWWHKTVGTMNNLAQRSPEFKRVYDATQNFINDVSAYGTAAADLAPTILPKLEGWKDIAAKPLSPADTKAISAPIFEGTLTWARDGKGRPVKLASLEDAAAGMSAQDKAQAMLRDGKVGSDELKRWQNLPIDSYEGAIRNRYEREYLTAGVVWRDAELRSMFGLNDKQIGLYREFRAATDKSLTNLAISDMLRYGGDDVAAVRQAALDAPNIDVAAELLRDHLFTQAEADPDRADVLNSTGNGMIDKADKAKSLMQRGYAPLSRFGQYTVYVTEGDEQRYFGMFESAAEANRMARRMKAEFPDATIQQGTVSQEAYKMFAGVSPETLELFGGMLGLETQGNDASSQAFQTYLKLAKSNRSAMKRLIQRKGIAGFSEDAGRVLAGFVYSNARQTSSNLHMGEMTKAASDVSKGEGELKDQAVRLVDYVKNPQEEAQALRGLLFAQYLGGSVASAMVNVTQPFAVTLPYLSQYGGAIKAGGQMRRALADVFKKSTGDAALDAALKKAEDDGIVSPQEVHQLMAQAQGRGSLKSGDGTRAGDAAAKASNALSKLSLAWGKFFSTAEQFNRRITYIAAYRTAVDQGMADPAAFAADVVSQTQFTYNKGNKPAWARGAIGGTLFTFKQYSISYVELMNRLWRSGPEGKKAALLGLAILMLLSGVDELPFVEDAEDVIDGALQRMGYNFSTKQQREQFLTNLLGEGVGRFVQKGVSGLPGVPVDLSGRLGMGNLLPGTGLFMKKTDYSRDIGEFAGPAGDFAKRLFQGAGQALGGDIGKAATTVSPVAARNVVKAFDMAGTGMYRDDRGRKVLDTTAYEAAAKAIGFQPTDVARVQDATGMQQRMIALVKIRETEIADRWAQGIFEKSPDKVAAARAELLDWNTKNPEAPIRIAPTQVKKRVQTMSQDKATRIAKTAPSEIRDAVRRELAGIDR